MKVHTHTTLNALAPRYLDAICHDSDEDDDTDEEASLATLDKGAVRSLIQKRFLKERKVFLWGAVDDASARDVTEKVLYLDLVDPGKEITFYINSPGGSVTAGLVVYDTMKLIRSPIKVVAMGLAASMGSILLCVAPKGRRYLFPHAQVLIHQPLITGRMQGVAVDIAIHAQEMERTRHRLNHILAQASGQPLSKIEKDTDRDFYMSAQEAIDYGLADAITEAVL
jgi:ATP-dependent Clp protease protease subunit